MVKDTTIHHRITAVLRDKFQLSEAVLDPRNWDKPLTGRQFGFSGVDLVYLLFELEKAFSVRLPAVYLDAYGFCTINRIAEAIRECRSAS